MDVVLAAAFVVVVVVVVVVLLQLFVNTLLVQLLSLIRLLVLKIKKNMQ